MVRIMRELLNELGFCNVDHAMESDIALNKGGFNDQVQKVKRDDA
jgi:hypothetical protein